MTAKQSGFKANHFLYVTSLTLRGVDCPRCQCLECIVNLWESLWKKCVPA